MTDQLTHIDQQGRASMVDVSGKPQVRRVAVAEGFFEAAASTIAAILDGDLPKGEALAVARVAGIGGAKMCDRLIPLCHPLPLEQVTVSFDRDADDRIRIEASATVTARTGIEMEALTAVSVAALTLWDMTKAIDKGLRISGIRIIHKEKGV